MKKNTLLLSDIISADFLIANSKNGLSFKMLDLYEISKNLKQFLSILKFVVRIETSFVYLLVRNKFLYYIIKKFLTRFNKAGRILVINNVSSLKQGRNIRNNSLIISLDAITQTNETIKNLLENNIFLIYNIGINIRDNSSGMYIMKNNLDDYKKLIFLLVILMQILNKE